MRNKLQTLESIDGILIKLRNEKKKIVHCHGVFDLLHPGHLKHFEAAKKFGDILIVSVTEDKHVNKGPGRPIFNEKLRAETIASIQFVDYVLINHFPTANPAIDVIQPDFYVKGQDYKNVADDFTGGILSEKNAVEKYGGKIVFTDEIQFSSTKLINTHIDVADQEVTEYLDSIRNSVTFQKILEYFNKISKFNVLVIGDIILDEYQFVKPLGKASKSSAITSKKLYSELYLGGSLAVTNHIADFVKSTTLLTVHGINDNVDYTDFINSNIHSDVNLVSFKIQDRPTIVKRRFVDSLFKNKLFEVIEINDNPLPSYINDKLLEYLKNNIHKYDLVVISDFGHGLISPEIIDFVTSKDVFLSINTQTNSANIGFNILTKYPRCNYFSIDKEEARLATHDRYTNIELLLSKLVKKTNANIGAVTLGTEGSMAMKRHTESFSKAPVLSKSVVDTIGAGDAYLAITSLLAKLDVSPEEIAFIGNAVGAMAVKIIGNKSYIEKVPLLKYLKTLLT